MFADNVLLVGNGINRTTENNENWDGLLEVLSNKVDLPKEKKNGYFPLIFYENIYLYGMKNKKIKNEHELKTAVKETLDKFRFTELHEKIVNSGFGNILTTNYDYTLENSVGGLNKAKITSEIKETRYSLFRRKEINGVNIWHIHGELGRRRASETIMLGQEQYGGYMQHMRNYIISGRDELKSVRYRMENGDKKIKDIKSWVDLFFSKDIYIYGFGLDFSEYPLWWLLSFRHRKKFHKKLVSIIESYIEDLKNSSEEDLRKNFQKKMNYICRINSNE